MVRSWETPKMIPDNIAPGITRTHKGLQDDNLAIHGVVSLVLGVSCRRPRGSRTHWRDDWRLLAGLGKPHVEWCPGRGKCGLLCLGCINNYLNNYNYFSRLVPFLFIEKQLESRHCCSPGWTAANFLCNRIRKQNSSASRSLPTMQHKRTHKGKPVDIFWWYILHFHCCTKMQEMFFLSIQGRKKVWQMESTKILIICTATNILPNLFKSCISAGLYHASVTAWEILQQIIPTPPFFPNRFFPSRQLLHHLKKQT